MMTLDVTFAGAAEDKKIASALFDAMRGQGRFMSVDEPIRVDIDSLTKFLQGQFDAIDSARVRAVVDKNPKVFAVEEREELVLVLTTRTGRAPVPRAVDGLHTFAQRMMTPLPKPEVPIAPPRPRPRVANQWGDITHLLDPLEMAKPDIDFDVPAIVVSEPVVAPEPIRPVPVEIPTPAPEVIRAKPAPQEDVVVAPRVREVEVPPAPPVQPPAVDIVVEPAVAPPVVEVAAVVVPVAPVAPPPPPAPEVRLPVIHPAKFEGIDDVTLAETVADRLIADPRVANFGDRWMLEDRVPRFSRGDLRRLREYLQEQEQPLTDDALAQDVLGGRPGSPDFEVLRFAVNVRLSKEHREFDFVGTRDQRFWSTGSLPQIGTTRRKPNEIGTDYRFLLDESPAVPGAAPASVDHILTFYEYSLGLLPFDEHLQAILPGPLLPNQRSAVFTFESMQTYTTYLVELRYPTPNRGGFILGLDDFYNESLVPGALITIEPTANNGHYQVKFLPAPAQSARLLELEERRGRYVFRPTTYACGVMDEYLLTEERFPNYGSEKPLEEKVRRRPEAIVAATFERLGHKSDGPGFVASFEDLMTAVNIERPFSERYLRSILENDETGAFALDPDGQDAYTYVPGSTG
jgi:hypothetical protein